ncbi:hypothetical protein IWZ01DRAFT_537263 [Phyllosticta capitalensis]
MGSKASGGIKGPGGSKGAAGKKGKKTGSAAKTAKPKAPGTSPSFHPPAPPLAAQDHQLFRSRVAAIISHFCPETTAIWFLEILAKKTAEEWADVFVQYTPKKVRQMFSKTEPPSVDELLSFSSQKSSNFGAYMCLVVPLDNGHHHHIYGGSATSPFGGLHTRISAHQNPAIKQKEPNYFHNLLHQEDVRRRGYFFHVFDVPGLIPCPEDQMTERRAICMIAEAVYTAWFGAYRAGASRVHASQYQQCPYNINQLGWWGTCSHLLLEDKSKGDREMGGDMGGEMKI